MMIKMEIFKMLWCTNFKYLKNSTTYIKCEKSKDNGDLTIPTQFRIPIAEIRLAPVSAEIPIPRA